jgi:hypothetical protein
MLRIIKRFSNNIFIFLKNIQLDCRFFVWTICLLTNKTLRGFNLRRTNYLKINCERLIMKRCFLISDIILNEFLHTSYHIEESCFDFLFFNFSILQINLFSMKSLPIKQDFNEKYPAFPIIKIHFDFKTKKIFLSIHL